MIVIIIIIIIIIVIFVVQGTIPAGQRDGIENSGPEKRKPKATKNSEDLRRERGRKIWTTPEDRGSDRDEENEHAGET